MGQAMLDVSSECFTAMADILTVLGDDLANRSETLTGNFRLLNGESDINVISGVGRTDTLAFGAAAATFSKNQGGTLHFTESGAGTALITLQATGLTNSGIMSYATYGSTPGAATDFASNGASGAIGAFTGYVAGGSEAAVRDKGLLRMEGKEYVVQDGDCMHFRFNV